MAATGTTQTTSTAASTASPAAGATPSTAEHSSAGQGNASESGDAFDRALAADFAKHRAETETGKEEANRGTAAAADKSNKEGEKPEGETEHAQGDEGGEDGPEGKVEGEGTSTEEGATEHGEESEDETASQEALTEGVDPEHPPKGMENVPKSVWKRFNHLTKENKKLNAQVAEGGIKITPTAASPLADVDNLKSLEARITSAKGIRDAVKSHPEYLTDGAKIKRGDGSTIERTADQVKAQLAKAEAEIDGEANARVRLTERNRDKPWEAAASMRPDLFKKGTADHSFMVKTLQDCPEIKTRLTDWEVFMAAAARGFQEMIEEQDGKALYVRNELKDGKPLPPKQQQTKPAGDPTKVKPKTPGGTKPALNGRGNSKVSPGEALAALPAGATQEDRLNTALEAAFG